MINQKSNKLWTKDFTIIIVGSFISMLGNASVGAVFGFLVLGQTDSTLLFALIMVANMLPQLFVPIFAGIILDRRSRVKAIYILDYITTLLFIVVTIVLKTNFYNYLTLLVITLLMGSINSFYSVAYESLYPNLISKGNYSKAYTISSLLYPIASVIMVPVAGIVYSLYGATPIFLFASIVLFITATVETRVTAIEPHLENLKSKMSFSKIDITSKPRENSLEINQSASIESINNVDTKQNCVSNDTNVENSAIKSQKCVNSALVNGEKAKRKHNKRKNEFIDRFIGDAKAGINYLKKEKGLMTITIYFFFIQGCGCVMSALFQPYINANFSDYTLTIFGASFILSVTMQYSFITTGNTLGRLIGGVFHYFRKLKTEKRYAIAIFVYTSIAVIDMVLLFMPNWWLIALLYVINGALAVTSFNIRISSTQNYVPDQYRARFNASFQLINAVGMILGQFIGGSLGEVFDSRYVIVVAMLINLVAMYLIMVGNKKYVKPIYNTEL